MALSCSKKLSAFSRGITSKHQRGFYCLNCLHSFTTKNKLESHKNLCEYKKFSRNGFFFFIIFFRAWAERCRVPFPEIQDKLCFEKI